MTDEKTVATSEAEDDERIVDLDDASEIIPFKYSITSYGADYPVDSLVKRVEAKDILVPTFNWQQPENSRVVGFQRQYVWPRPKADRFIESLLLGLPVPGIFLVKEESGILLVLDGHQRLRTLHAFYEGVIDGQEYRLQNVQQSFVNKRYKDLDPDDRRRLDDSIIHATVIRQDEPSADQSSIYLIFERLNTGGVNLQPQEIRVALYHGEYVQVLQRLNETEAWRRLYGRQSKRLKDMELILRFFGFLYFSKEYRRPMKDFLNRCMAANRQLEKQSTNDLTGIFLKTTEIILNGIGPGAFRPRGSVNAAVVDSVMTGVAKRLLHGGDVKNPKVLKREYDALMANPTYIASVETGTSQETNVNQRSQLAEAAFSKVP